MNLIPSFAFAIAAAVALAIAAPPAAAQGADLRPAVPAPPPPAPTPAGLPAVPIDDPLADPAPNQPVPIDGSRPAEVRVAPRRMEPACDAAQVERARLSINAESRAARRWNTAWIISYTALTGIQVGAALAEISINDFDDAAEAALYIGAGKALIGAASRLVLPLRIPQVAASGDACTDAAAIDRSRAIARRKEQRTFWLQLGGGLALHVLGGGYLGLYEEDGWGDALTSFGLGVVTSGLTLYTQPKTSWRSGSRSATLAPMPMRGGAGLAVVGGF